MIFFVDIHSSNTYLIQEFLGNAGKSLETFRYYNKRTFDVIQNHLSTIVLKQNDHIVGYGHLDKEGERVWLGIAVIESELGKGLGLKIMNELIKNAKQKKIKSLSLSVDKLNTAAIQLYEKLGFKKSEEKDSIYFYELLLNEK